MGRAVLGVIAGYLGIAALAAFTNMLFAALVPGWRKMVHPPIYYFAVSLGTNFLYSIVGGYICAATAEEHWRGAILSLILLGELIGIVAQLLLWKTVPHWYGLGLLILYPIGIWIGSSLRGRREALSA